MHRSVRLESKKIVQLDTQQCGLSWFIIIFPKIAIDLGCFRDRTDWTTLDSPVFFSPGRRGLRGPGVRPEHPGPRLDT